MLMRQMRQNTKIIMLVTALAFVALMVFEWGMDMSGQSFGGGNLGRVGGTTVSAQEYQNTYRSLYNRVQQVQSQPISAAQNREIEDMAWDEIVDQILIREELRRRGIRVSDEEIRQAALYAPPPEFRNDPAFLNEAGQFDLAAYQQFLSQVSQDTEFMRQLEMYYRESIPQEKLARQVTAGIHVSDRELWERWRDQNERVSITFFTVSPEEHIADGAVEVSSAEVERYYEENRQDYRISERAQVRYTYLDVGSGGIGDEQARELALELRSELEEGADFADVARRESADATTTDRGGELDRFGRGDMEPALEDAAFSLPIGEISEPVRGARGYHLLEVLERDDDQVLARHILVPVERTGAEAIAMLMRADSLETMATSRSLDEAAEHFGLEILEADITADFPILPGIGPAEEASAWLFEEREGPGVVSPLFETDDTFYLVETIQRWPSGYLTLQEVRPQIEAILRAERKRERVRDEVRGWVSELRGGDVSVEEMAERLGFEVQTAESFTRQSFVPGLGERSPAIGAAFGTAEGRVTGPVDAQDRIAVLRVDEREEPSREDWEAQKATQRASVKAEIQQARLQQWLQGLRETTTVVDDRAAYFRAAEEQQDQPQIPLAF